MTLVFAGGDREDVEFTAPDAEQACRGAAKRLKRLQPARRLETILTEFKPGIGRTWSAVYESWVDELPDFMQAQVLLPLK